MQEKKNFIYKTLVISILTGILILVFVINFEENKYLIGNDNYSPELNSELSLSRSIENPGFREYRAWGIPSDSEQSDIFRSGYFYILENLGVSKENLSQGYAFFSLFTGAIFAGLCSKYLYKYVLFKEESTFISSQNVFLFSTLVYLMTLQTLGVFYFKTNLFVALYGFGPPVVYFTLRLINEKAYLFNFLSFLFFISLLLTAALNMTLFISFLLLWFAFVLSMFIAKSREISVVNSFSKIRFVLLSMIVFTLFITLPFFYFYINNADEVSSSYINRSITYWQVEAEATNNNIYKTLMSKYGWMNVDFQSNEVETVPFKDHYELPSTVIIVLILHISVLLTIPIIIIKKRYSLLLLFLIYFLGIFFITADSTPWLRWILDILKDTIPYLEQAIRWSSSKFWFYILLMLSIFSGIFLGWLTSRLNSLEGKNQVSNFILLPIKAILPISIVLCLLFLGYPIIKGELFFDRYYLDIPEEYFSLEEYIREEEIDRDRILYLPEAKTQYFREYNWDDVYEDAFDHVLSKGFIGSDFLHYIIPNPLVSNSLVIGSEINELNFETLIESIYSEDETIFNNLVKKYDIDLILLDKSMIGHYWEFDYNWENYRTLTYNNDELELFWEEGYLSLFRVKDSESKYKRLYSGHANKYLSRLLGITEKSFYSDSSGKGIIYPLFLEGNVEQETENFLTLSQKYKGEGTVFISNFDTISDDVPTRIELEDENIVLTPAYPDLFVNQRILSQNTEEIKLSFPKKPTLLEINGQYYDIKNKENLVIDQSYSTINLKNISFFLENNQYSDLLPTLDGKEVVYCEGKYCEAKIIGSVIPLTSDNKIMFGIATQTPALVNNKIVTTELLVKSEGTNKLVVCIYSPMLEECLNQNSSNYLLSKGYNKIIAAPEKYFPDDKLTIFLNWQSLDSEKSAIEIDEFNSILYEKIDLFDIEINIPPFQDEIEYIAIENGDILSVNIPLIEGNSTAEIKGSTGYSDFSLYPSDENCFDDKVKSIGVKILIKSNRCNLYISKNFQLSDNSYDSDLGLVYIDHDKLNNGPLNYSIQSSDNIGQTKEFYRQISPLPDETNALDYFILPPNSDLKYKLSLTSRAEYFPESRDNTEIRSLRFQKIPDSWSEMKLVPIDNDFYDFRINNDIELISKGEAGFADNLERGNVINGWGVEQRENQNRLHFSNLLAYTGYYLIVFFIFILALSQLSKLLKSKLIK